MYTLSPSLCRMYCGHKTEFWKTIDFPITRKVIEPYDHICFSILKQYKIRNSRTKVRNNFRTDEIFETVF